MSSTILVVDDEARFREILGLALQRAGHRVLAAGDGRAALALLETETVDVGTTSCSMVLMTAFLLHRSHPEAQAPNCLPVCARQAMPHFSQSLS